MHTEQRSDSWDIVVVGGANYDYLGRGAQLPRPGETRPGDLVDEAPGGKGANQAVAAARLGARVAFIGRLGMDERGARLLESFQREGVDTAAVVRDNEAPTGVALIMVGKGGQKQILSIGGANLRLTSADVTAAAAVIRRAKVLLVQLEVPMEAVVTAAHIAREAGVKVLLDPAPAIDLPDALLRLVDWIKPNSNEAQILTGVVVQDPASARAAATQLKQRGAGSVAVTAGSEGTLAVWPGGERLLKRLPVKSIDATGAGDAFAGALGVALAEGQPFVEACAFANAAAALATTIVGAQAAMPSRDAVLAVQRQFPPC